GAGAHLDDDVAGAKLRQARDLAGDVEVEQEVLAEGFAGHQAMLGERFAKRRQVLEAHSRVRAIWSASRTAAIRLSARARPRPAMSKAVPWSGEVLTMGRPRVTFTPPQKSSIFTGISAWSW